MKEKEAVKQKISYYPGCSLSTTARVLDEQARKIAALFGYELEDIAEWTCCGTVFPNSLSDIMKFVGAYRMLANTELVSDKLLTLCSACFNVLKRSNKVIKENQEIREKLRLFTELEYKGNVKVVHYLEFLRDQITYQVLKEKVAKKKSEKISPYYGCLILRPASELELDDPENPKFIAEIIELIGDTVVQFPAQNECCGAYLAATSNNDQEIAKKITTQAAEFGVEQLVTTCPLCYYNLEQAAKVKTVYFTDYLAKALGVN